MIPSVTQVLKFLQDFKAPEPFVAAAAERGARVHCACAAYALSLPIDELPNDEIGYLTSFQKWFDTTIARVIAVEREYQSQLGFVGHPDLVCQLKGSSDIVVIELKTPRSLSKVWRLQIAAYAHLTGAQRCLILRLHPNGDYPLLTEITNWHQDFVIFLNALSVWRFLHG